MNHNGDGQQVRNKQHGNIVSKGKKKTVIAYISSSIWYSIQIKEASTWNMSNLYKKAAYKKIKIKSCLNFNPDQRLKSFYLFI